MDWPSPTVAIFTHMDTERDGNGRYELKDETRLDVEVVGVYWVGEGGPPSLLVVLGSRERVQLLGEAVARYLTGRPADAGM